MADTAAANAVTGAGPAAGSPAQLATLAGVIDAGMTRQLKQYLDVCARCAICKDACHQYVATRDVRYLPAYRAELVRRVYKKYFDRTGRFVPTLYGARDPDEDLLDELYEVTYACTGCRRCMYYCPFSIDTQLILSVAKAMLIAAGKGQEMMRQLADAAIFKGEHIAEFRDALVAGFRTVEQEVREITGDPTAEIPIEEQGADVLYVPLAGAHTMRPAAVIFHGARESWTLSMFEAANYGLFFGDPARALTIANCFMDEATRLGVKEVVIAECGHAYRVAAIFHEAWSGRRHPFRVRHILEKVDEYIKDGRIRVDRHITEPVAYHDPCQIARNGGLFEQPRDIVRAIAADFREMTPNRAEQWCCGGGGGIVAVEEMNDLRLKSGEKKVEQIRATGARIIASPCENCRLQMEQLVARHELDVRIAAVIDLVVEAMPSGQALRRVAVGA